jgi:hypothetical protein
MRAPLNAVNRNWGDKEIALPDLEARVSAHTAHRFPLQL